MYLGNNAALLGCQEYFNRCAAAGSPIGGTQTPTSYDNAASFNGTTQFLSNASFTQGGSFTAAFWVNPRNANFNGIFNKGFQNGTAYDWQVFTIGSAVYLQGGTPSQTVNVNRPITLNQWSFVVVTYDSSTLVKSISVNNGIASSNTGTGAMANSSSSINFSFIYNGSNSVEITAAGYWNRVLTASEVTALFNSGAGRTYASLDSGLRTNLVSWWALNQNSVTADSHGTNTLTNNGTVTAPNIGPVVTSLADPRQLIIDFAQGIDRLGLWNSMVCWPLRSSQNAGGGTTAFSLGGLGRFNGTLVNAPTWGSSGINFNKTATQFIGTSLNPNLTNNGIFVCSDWSQISSSEIQITAIGNRDIYGSGGRGASLGVTNASNLRAISSPDGTTINSFQITPLPTGFGCHSMLSNGSVLTVNQNNTQVATQTIVSGTTQVSLNIGSALYAQYTYKGVIPFAAAFYAPVSNTAIYNLYKSTLGLGLGLP